MDALTQTDNDVMFHGEQLEVISLLTLVRGDKARHSNSVGENERRRELYRFGKGTSVALIVVREMGRERCTDKTLCVVDFLYGRKGGE